MAILYVRSGEGATASPYDTWAKAAATLQIAFDDAACVAGSTVYVCSKHTEDEATTKAIDPVLGTMFSRITVISVDSTGDPEPPAADDYEAMVDAGTPGDIKTTGVNDDITIAGFGYYYGLTFDSADRYAFYSADASSYHDCKFIGIDAVDFWGNESVHEFIDCVFDFSSSLGVMSLQPDMQMSFKNCSWLDAKTTGICSANAADGVSVTWEDCDLSTEATLVLNPTAERTQFTFRRCKLHADTLATPYTGTIDHPHTWILIESCQSGEVSARVPGLNYFSGAYGTIVHDETEYRDSGASDGTNFSWVMTSSANTLERHAALKTPPLWKKIGTGAQTLTVYLTSNVALEDDEIWLEIESPDEAATDYAQYDYVTTLPVTVLTAPQALSAGGTDADWQTTLGNYLQITATLTPITAGNVIVRICLGKASTSVNVDPKIYLAAV